MFAIVKTGGKQYRVSPGDVIAVEKLLGQAGDVITLSNILMVGQDDQTTIGQPFVTGASVQASIREQTRGDKVIVFKKRRRQGYRRKKGHRQDLTLLTINEILMNGQMPAKASVSRANPVKYTNVEETLPEMLVSDAKPKKKAVSKAAEVASTDITAEKPKRATAKTKKESQGE